MGPNFYYGQKDCLKAFAQNHAIEWNTTRLCHVLRAVPDADINLCYPLAMQERLHKSLQFPEDLAAWDQSVSLSSAQGFGYINEWIVLTERAENESFNAVNCPSTWSEFWPKLAERFQVPWTGPDTSHQASYEAVTLRTILRPLFSDIDWAGRVGEGNGSPKGTGRDRGGTLVVNKGAGGVDRVLRFADLVLSMTYPVRLR
ncbi:uncharacterized protein N7459_006950 [Penicillium hispanicum]|uniref:uncharacterized protein n=1 Tax=Penicillium hispanicum TaxID=1080232 RepID=UPI00253FF6A4|nr:uncharacterized protein N7459_006950 [Penicillium hispanicum]KAJ5577986.1 hypothetical protein N7459_006950 [Penicillium hispanicum]